MRFAAPVRLRDGSLPTVSRPKGQNATHFVHDYLKQLILDLTIPPDTLIMETDVVAVTGLSRTPIREALLRLHEERLVELLPRRGALVPRISAGQVRELYDVRLLLETRAAEIICEDGIYVTNRLLALCDEQDELDRSGALASALIQVDRRFHSTLIAMAGNSVMAAINDSLGDQHQRVGVLSFTLDRRRCAIAVENHRAIARALAERDLPATKKTLEEHHIVGERDLERLLLTEQSRPHVGPREVISPGAVQARPSIRSSR